MLASTGSWTHCVCGRTCTLSAPSSTSVHAFDTSWVEVTLVRMHQVGVTGGMWRTVANFLCGTLSQVRVCGDVSPPWVDTGIASGRVLSPLLFNLLVNSLAAAIRNRRFTCQLYADVARDHLQNLEADLQAVSFSAVTLWGLRWGFSLQNPKAERNLQPWCSDPHAPGRLAQSLSTAACWKSFPSYRYLGVVLTPSLRWEAHIAHILASGRRLFCTKYLVGPLRRPACLLLALSALHLRSSQCDFRNESLLATALAVFRSWTSRSDDGAVTSLDGHHALRALRSLMSSHSLTASACTLAEP